MSPARLAAIHAACFAAAPRPWTAAEFAALLAGAGTVLLTEPEGFAPEGFALIRVAGGEAELLTLAVLPGARRRGVGRRLVAAALAAAAARGAAAMFLEVAEANAAARALYAGAGFVAAGRRRGYHGGGDALVLRRDLAVG